MTLRPGVEPDLAETRRSGDLHRLVEIEDEIARDLDLARAEAEAIEEVARRAIAQAEGPWTAQLDAEIESRRREDSEKSLRAMRDIEERARLHAARFDAVDGEQAETLAALVIERLLEDLDREAAGAMNGDENDHPNDESPDPGPAGPAS
jgi:hypothetical protein